MGLRLRFLYWWTPNYVIRRELANLSTQTNSALQSLLDKYVEQKPTLRVETQNSGTVKEQRLSMAQNHVKMVEALEASVGHEKAVELGRAALLLVGENLGKQTRIKLGVGESPNDLTMAAKILYRVLGIDFRIKWLDDSTAKVMIDHCALAERYSEFTCQVLSATDEGVIKGLQPNVRLKFTQYMTSGCGKCKAALTLTKEANT
jgi:hypothetical protein